MKKILFLLIVSSLCFLGCENPHSSKADKNPPPTPAPDPTPAPIPDPKPKPEVLFYGFIPARYYVIKEDNERSCELTTENKFFVYWGGVKQEIQRDGEGYDKYDLIDKFEKIEKTDEKLVLELIVIDSEDGSAGKELYTLTKESDASIKVLNQSAFKAKEDDPWSELEEELSLTLVKGEKPESKFLVEYDTESGKKGQVSFYFNTNFEETGTTYEVHITTKDGTKVDNKTLEFGTFMPQFLEISGFKKGQYIINLHFKNENWEDNLIKTYTLIV
ncbi:MAG: hypothetical protein MI862_11250 [Desulfobacterales bacterium]|nr:hypothetical protein [Desulfobacterales bacterium]